MKHKNVPKAKKDQYIGQFGMVVIFNIRSIDEIRISEYTRIKFICPVIISLVICNYLNLELCTLLLFCFNYHLNYKIYIQAGNNRLPKTNIVDAVDSCLKIVDLSVDFFFNYYYF